VAPYSALRPLAGLRGPTFKRWEGREGKGVREEKMGKEGKGTGRKRKERGGEGRGEEEKGGMGTEGK